MISIASGSCQYVTSFTTGSLWILVFWECSCNIKSNDVRPKTWLYFLFSRPLVCSYIHEADVASVKGWEWGQVREGCKEDLHIFRRNLRANKFAGNTRAHPEIHEISLRRVIKKHERSRKKNQVPYPTYSSNWTFTQSELPSILILYLEKYPIVLNTWTFSHIFRANSFHATQLWGTLLFLDRSFCPQL